MSGGWWREYVTKRLERSKDWSKVRRKHLRLHPYCESCGKRGGNHVHHNIPFAVAPSRELVPGNLTTMCPRCHLLIGHGGNWQTYIPGAVRLARHVRNNVVSREKI